MTIPYLQNSPLNFLTAQINRFITNYQSEFMTKLLNRDLPADYYRLETPCFIFDKPEFEHSISAFKSALNQYFMKPVIGYSVKTNSLPYAMSLARKYGCRAEVVSHDEFKLACLCGFNPSEIIYNGPLKSKETFIKAVTGGAMVNLETKREIDWLLELPKSRNYNIGIRLNINISHISSEDAGSDDDNSRFGFSDESTEFQQALEFITSLGFVNISGLHIHRTAHSRSPRFYERSVAYAASVIKKYNLKLEYLDVGGGYFGIFPDKPTFDDYVEAIYRPLKMYGLENLKIIVEPGNALTASAFSFITEVIDVKRVDDKTRFVTTDGSRNDVDPFFRKNSYLHDITLAGPDRPIEPLQIVTGGTCLEYDRLFTLTDYPRLEVGDRIKYNNVGAYTMTLSPQFIRLWPRVYAIGESGEYKIVRRESRAEDLMNLNNY